MTDRILTERELNRALLARQGLLERFAAGMPRALQRIGGLQAQYAPSMYVGLWSRRPACSATTSRARWSGRRGRGPVDRPRPRAAVGNLGAAPGGPAPVRYLPTWDARLLVHARRTGLLPEQHRPAIFDVRNPHSLPTFLVDGVAFHA